MQIQLSYDYFFLRDPRKGRRLLTIRDNLTPKTVDDLQIEMIEVRNNNSGKLFIWFSNYNRLSELVYEIGMSNVKRNKY